MKKPDSVDEYIHSFPKDVQAVLEQVRTTIKKEAPEAVEGISYGMPSYKTHKRPLVYFAGHKNHIGFYATPSSHLEFKEELSTYKQGKGSIQFPFDRPIPFDLIAQIVKFRVKENNKKFGGV